MAAIIRGATHVQLRTSVHRLRAPNIMDCLGMGGCGFVFAPMHQTGLPCLLTPTLCRKGGWSNHVRRCRSPSTPRCRLEEVELRRLEAKLTRDGAASATAAQAAFNHAAGANARAAAACRAAAAQADLDRRRANNAEQSAFVRAERAQMHAAMGRWAANNAGVATGVHQASRAGLRRLAAEREAERRERTDLVRRLSAAEKVPMPCVAAFDPTEGADHGLLSEMSLQVLRSHLPL